MKNYKIKTNQQIFNAYNTLIESNDLERLKKYLRDMSYLNYQKMYLVI